MSRRILMVVVLVMLLSVSGFAAAIVEKHGLITVDGTGVAWCYREKAPCPLLKLLIGKPDPHNLIDIRIEK